MWFQYEMRYFFSRREPQSNFACESVRNLELNHAGCFFYGYTVSVGILGLTADIIGARYMIGSCLLLSSIISCFYELFASFGFGYLVALR